MSSLFHFAYHVTDLESSRAFYCDLLGCQAGRSTETWLDIDFFGHQLSLHLGTPFPVENTGKVGEHMVPMPHLGVILEMDAWVALSERLMAEKISFVLSPSIRFQGMPGEQATMFFLDPSGNPIEVKGFADLQSVYAV